MCISSLRTQTMQLPWGVFSFLLSYGSVLSIFSLFTTCAQFSLSCLFWRSSQIAKFQISPYRHTQSVFTFLWNLLSKTTLQHPRFRSLFPTVLLVRYAKEVLEELLQSVKRNIKFGALLMFLSQHRDWNKAKAAPLQYCSLCCQYHDSNVIKLLWWSQASFKICLWHHKESKSVSFSMQLSVQHCYSWEQLRIWGSQAEGR